MAQSSANTVKQSDKAELSAKMGKSSGEKKSQKSKSNGKTVEHKKIITKKSAPKQVDPPKLISKPAKSAKRKEIEKKSKKASIKADFELGREEAAAYLQNLANGLKSGSMSFRKDENEVVLLSGEKVSLKIKGKSSGKKGRLSVDLNWENPKSENSKSD